MNPLVSVVIPTYNRVSFLMRAIESATNQTYRPLEIIVGDDGSTDDTANRVASLGDPVRLLPLAHTGRPSYVRNRVLEHARGEYVAFLDDDDTWHREKLSLQIDVLKINPDIGFVFTNASFALPNGELSPPLFAPPTDRGNMFSGLLRDCFIHPSTAVARKAKIEEAGGFDEELSTIEDFDLWLRIARLTNMIFLPEALVTIQKHEGQLSTNREHDTWRNMLRVLGRVRAVPGLRMGDKLRSRRTLAKTHNRLAALETGSAVTTHYMNALRWNPLSRTGWRGLIRSVFTSPR